MGSRDGGRDLYRGVDPLTDSTVRLPSSPGTPVFYGGDDAGLDLLIERGPRHAIRGGPAPRTAHARRAVKSRDWVSIILLAASLAIVTAWAAFVVLYGMDHNLACVLLTSGEPACTIDK